MVGQCNILQNFLIWLLLNCANWNHEIISMHFVFAICFDTVRWVTGRHPACKKLDVGLLVVMIALELCTTYSSSSAVVTTTSIILCFNKQHLTQVQLENGS